MIDLKLSREWRVLAPALVLGSIFVGIGGLRENLVILSVGMVMVIAALVYSRVARERTSLAAWRASNDAPVDSGAAPAASKLPGGRYPSSFRATWLASGAQAYIKDPDGMVRVQDWLAALGAITGEAALVASGVIDVESTDAPPGSGIFGDDINQVLTGGAAELDDVDPTSVYGILFDELVPDVVAASAFPSPAALYEHVAATVNHAEFGNVTTSTPGHDGPLIQPLRTAFELRHMVDQVQIDLGAPTSERHVPCALAAAEAIREIVAARVMEPAAAVKMLLEVTFAMAKVVPMSRSAIERAAEDVGSD